jgi:hypothetical protein
VSTDFCGRSAPRARKIANGIIVAKQLLVIVSVGAALAGGCGSGAYVNGHAVSPDEYARATAPPPAPSPPRPPPRCQVVAADTDFATIDCRYVGSPTLKDWRHGIAAELRLAAQTSVIAGKVAIALVGRETPSVHTANYTSPVACVRSVNGLRAVGVFLGGMGGAYQDHAHCSTTGGDTDCTFIPAQRVPDIHDTTCVGGTTTTYVSEVVTRSRWRFLTDIEARAPQMALLPDANKPIACQLVLSPDLPPTRAPIASRKPSPQPTTKLPLETQWPAPSKDPDAVAPVTSDAPAAPPSKKWTGPFVDER